MPAKTHPLPVKWYLASLVGALLLALLLMAIFSTRGGKNHGLGTGSDGVAGGRSELARMSSSVEELQAKKPTVSSSRSDMKSPADPATAIDATRLGNQNNAADSSKSEESKAAGVSSASSLSLWSLLVRPETIIAALAIVMFATLLGMRNLALSRRQTLD
jgi:hypothetical protein